MTEETDPKDKDTLEENISADLNESKDESESVLFSKENTNDIPKNAPSTALNNVLNHSGNLGDNSLKAIGLSQITPQLTIEQQFQKMKRDLESMVIKYAKSERENLQNQNKVDLLDKKLARAMKDNDALANRIRNLSNDKNHLTDTLNAKVAQLTVLEQKSLTLNNVQGVQLKEYEEKMKNLESANEDLLKQVENLKCKEAELLDFSEKLSMKHMMLQSDMNEALKKVPSYKEQYDAMVLERDNLLDQCKELKEEIAKMSKTLRTEIETCERLKNEKTENEIRYQSKLDELENEIKVLRRKHQVATKELIREIKQLQTQLVKVAPTSQGILKA